MRKHTCTSTVKHLNVSAKSLKKGDHFQVGTRVYTVKSNIKDDDGKRIIVLQWGTKKEKDSVLLNVPKDLIFKVRNYTHENYTK